MSKLYSTYLALKKDDPNTVFLFKSGIFYLALDKDAYYLANLLNFKLTDLNDNVKKAGFPSSSIDKYMTLFKAYNLNFKIIDTITNKSYSVAEYKQSESIKDITDSIKKLDIDSLSISQAYEFLYDIKKKVIECNQ